MPDDSTPGSPLPGVPPDPQDVAPRIELRVPGPWSGPADLNARLAAEGQRYETTPDAFVQTAGKHAGRRFGWGVSPPDDEIADLIAHGNRLSRQEVTALRGHTCKVHLTGPGGSVPAARAMMRAATALVRAGGVGVMIDSSTAAHGPRDWLKLAGDKEPGGLYWAYVTAAGKAGDEVFSIGMHCLGLRDAEIVGLSAIPSLPDLKAAGFVLHNFLDYTYQSGVPVLDGDPLGSEHAALFRARHYPCDRFQMGTPCYNPYGVWRLEPIAEDEG